MKIKTEVMFKLLKVIKKIGILEELKTMFKTASTKDKKELDNLQEEIGMDFVIRIIGGLDNAENEFYELIACVKEIDTKQARELELNETIEVLKAIFLSEVFKGFLFSLSK